MKVLFIVPKLCSPWSEGRKKFVRDLIESTAGRWQIALLATYDTGEQPLQLPGDQHVLLPVRYSYQHITRLRQHLRSATDRFQPDLVCHFPFGTFGGLRSYANLWFIRYVQNFSRQQSVPEITLMYSLTSEATTNWHSAILASTYRNQYSGQARSIRFGVRLPEVPVRAVVNGMPRRLLFMAGMTECTVERLDYALHTRGLGLLLECGKMLRQRGFSLTVAIPLLRSDTLRHRLLQAAGGWGDAITLQSMVQVPDIYAQHDVFMFPYAREELQFVPTSVVEAMHSGLPVVMPDLDFLQPFHSVKAGVQSYAVGSAAALVEAVALVTSDADYYGALAKNGKAFIDSEYDIGASVTDIEATWRVLSAR